VILFFNVTCGNQIMHRISRDRNTLNIQLLRAESIGAAPQDHCG
jgi:hypothetical protein